MTEHIKDALNQIFEAKSINLSNTVELEREFVANIEFHNNIIE